MFLTNAWFFKEQLDLSAIDSIYELLFSDLQRQQDYMTHF